jgi:hypothetical protein
LQKSLGKKQTNSWEDSIVPPSTTNLEYLSQELHGLDLLLERAIQQFPAARNRDKTTDFRAVYISNDEIDALVSTEEVPPPTWTALQAKALLIQAAEFLLGSDRPFLSLSKFLLPTRTRIVLAIAL